MFDTLPAALGRRKHRTREIVPGAARFGPQPTTAPKPHGQAAGRRPRDADGDHEHGRRKHDPVVARLVALEHLAGRGVVWDRSPRRRRRGAPAGRLSGVTIVGITHPARPGEWVSAP